MLANLSVEVWAPSEGYKEPKKNGISASTSSGVLETTAEIFIPFRPSNKKKAVTPDHCLPKNSTVIVQPEDGRYL